MKAAFEAPRFTRLRASLIAFFRKEKCFAWNWHYHPEIELTWIRRGQGRRLVGDHAGAYRAGDLVLIGSNLPHTWFSAATARHNEAIVVQFRPQAFPDALRELPEFSSVAGLLLRAGRGLSFPRIPEDVAKDLVVLPGENGLAAWLRLTRILHHLGKGKPPNPLASANYLHSRSHALNTRLERAISYMERHCREALPIPRIARLCGLTPNAFSRFFRRMTGQTCVSYRNLCRVREAGRALIETDHSITEIAFRCGFENLANFNRQFRKVHQMAPREYRAVHQAGRISAPG